MIYGRRHSLINQPIALLKNQQKNPKKTWEQIKKYCRYLVVLEISCGENAIFP